MEYTVEQLDEKLNRLIEILCDEQDIDIRKFNLDEIDIGSKRIIFRGLSNQRRPSPLSSEFMRLQDEILSFERDHKIIVDVNKLSYVNNMTIFLGDITTLRADAIVNAGNPNLLGSFEPCDSSIDNVIMSAGGLQIRQELNYLMSKQGHPEPNGRAKLTKGYNLPANYIIHTVGPMVFDRVSYHDKIDLANCYKSCLELAVQNGFKNIVFCCIATGTFRFPRDLGSKIAVTTVSNWLKENNYPIKVVFCVYNDHDRKLYEEKFAELNTII
ncbi:MAG: macro domain-containing protein [Clostridia bacterium]|nr:macro domain-containing protein [Clostridia bacterium]